MANFSLPPTVQGLVQRLIDLGNGFHAPEVVLANPTDIAAPTVKTVTSTVQRPNDTNAYAANDCWSTSTSAPTVGGNVLSGMGRSSGGSGKISDVVILSSVDPATLLQGELWIFDSAVTAVNDNAAFALSDTDAAKLVAVIPFTLDTTAGGAGANSAAHVTGCHIGYTCVGGTDLYYLIKVKNAYTPGAQETLTVRAKIEQGA